MAKSLTIAGAETLTELKGTTPRALLHAVRRNPDRFPDDFMFSLINQELASLKSQFVISKKRIGRGGRRSLPYAFTEQGVAMISSVLRSPVAVQVNIEIMRAFVRLRRAALISGELMKLIEDLSTLVNSHESVLGELAEAIRQLTESPPASRTLPIGFTADWGR